MIISSDLSPGGTFLVRPPNRMLKKSASTKKVEVQAKAEMKKVRGLLNLDLDLSLLDLLRPYVREAPAGFGLERLATAFTNSPG